MLENAKIKDEKKGLIEKAGMLLTDEELDKVAGGAQIYGGPKTEEELRTEWRLAQIRQENNS